MKNSTKIRKLETADEVYGWYGRHVLNPDKSKEPKMPFGVWLLHALGKERNGKSKIEVLSDWEWTTLVAAWRYYERRTTIASATFPGDVVRRFWGSGKYSDSVLRQIAHQFANVDHGRDGESYWTKDGTIGDCDRRSWCMFYAFCRGWCEGFTTVVLDATLADGRHLHQEPTCFRCEYTKRWHPVDEYVSDPHRHRWCEDAFITEVRK